MKKKEEFNRNLKLSKVEIDRADKFIKNPVEDIETDQPTLSPYSPLYNKETQKKAELKLAVLKENFKFQGFYQELKKNYRLPFPENFRLNNGFINSLLSQGTEIDNILKLLDPKKDHTQTTSEVRGRLPELFTKHGIHTCEASNLKPYERRITVDLRENKQRLIKEFAAWLDYVEAIREMQLDRLWKVQGGEAWDKEWDNWNFFDNSRFRKEIAEHLKVWKLRKQRKSFETISIKLGVSIDLAKKSFYRAYELIQREAFDPDRFRKEGWVIIRNDLSRICDNCSTRGTCTEACPEIMPYVNQDHVSLKEKQVDPSFL